MRSKWGKLRGAVQAENALRTGHHDADRLPVTRGLQEKRTDNPPPAEDRPAPVNAYSASYPRHSGEYAPPPRQNWAPQHDPYPYTGQPAYPSSQDHDHDPRYNPQQQQHPVSRHNTSPPSQGSAFNQNNPTAYQEPDSRPQYPPHQDHDSSHYQNSDPNGSYRPTPSSRSGSNQGYSGQPYQDPYPHTNTSPEAYDHGQSDYYGSNPHGQGHSYPQYPQSSSSDPPPLGPLGRATTVPANFPHPHGAPPNSGYNHGDYYGGNNHGGNNHGGNNHGGNNHGGNNHGGNNHGGNNHGGNNHDGNNHGGNNHGGGYYR